MSTLLPNDSTRLFDGVDELQETSKEIRDGIQKLIQYVLVIGALNGTASASKIVESITTNSYLPPTHLITKDYNEPVRVTNSREDEPSAEKAIN
jgi:hypothetical protein